MIKPRNRSAEYKLEGVLPPQLLSVKPQQKQQDTVNVILTWDIGNVKWSASTLKVPIREYDPISYKKCKVIFWEK